MSDLLQPDLFSSVPTEPQPEPVPFDPHEVAARVVPPQDPMALNRTKNQQGIDRRGGDLGAEQKARPLDVPDAPVEEAAFSPAEILAPVREKLDKLKPEPTLHDRVIEENKKSVFRITED